MWTMLRFSPFSSFFFIILILPFVLCSCIFVRWCFFIFSWCIFLLIHLSSEVNFSLKRERACGFVSVEPKEERSSGVGRGGDRPSSGNRSPTRDIRLCSHNFLPLGGPSAGPPSAQTLESLCVLPEMRSVPWNQALF